MKVIKSIVIILGLCIVSCNQTSEKSIEKSKAEETFEEAIRIHDAVMPKMGKIESLKAELKEIKALNREDSLLIEEQILRLDEASLAMRMWMHQLKIYPKTNIEAESNGHSGHNAKADTSYQVHLKQKEEILTIQDSINTSIDRAEIFITK